MKTILLSTVTALALSFPAMAQTAKPFGPNENVQTQQSTSQKLAPHDTGAEGRDTDAVPGVLGSPRSGAGMGATVGSGPARTPSAATPGLDTNAGETYAPNENVQTPQESSQDPDAIEKPASQAR